MIDCEYLSEQLKIIYNGYKSKKAYIEEQNENAKLGFPSYLEAKYAYKSCVFDYRKALAFNDDEQAKKLKNKQNELKAKLESIEKSLPVKLAKYEPHCKKCNDEAYIDGKLCHCYFTKLNELAYEYIVTPAPKLNDFSQNTLTDEKTLKLIDALKKYCNDFGDNSKSLLFFGKRGTGKTFLASCVAEKLSDNGKNAVFINAFQFNDILIRFLNASAQEKLNLKNILTTCDLLVIDDLGAAPVLNKLTAENLLMIISERQTLSKPFIITSNLTAEEIANLFGERVFSRLMAKTTAKIAFDGKDLRIG